LLNYRVKPVLYKQKFDSLYAQFKDEINGRVYNGLKFDDLRCDIKACKDEIKMYKGEIFKLQNSVFCLKVIVASLCVIICVAAIAAVATVA